MENASESAWTHDQVIGELIQVLQTHTDETAKLDEATELVGDLGIDSLGVMELVSELEDKFRLTIADNDLREVETIGDVARAIESRLRADGRWFE